MINSFHLLFSAWLPGRIVFGDVPPGPYALVISLGALLAVGIVIAMIVMVVGFVIRKIKKANLVKEEKDKPDQK